MNALLALIIKDCFELFRDKLALSLMILLPLVSLIIFGYGIRFESHNIPLAVFDQDRTALSRSFIDSLAASNQFMLTGFRSGTGIDEALRRGISVALLPEGFERAINTGQIANAEFFIDGTELNQAKQMQLLCRLVTSTFRPKITADTYAVVPNTSIWFNPSLREEQFIVPGTIGVLLWMFPSLLAAVATARELERPSLVQVRVARVPAMTQVACKLIVYLAVGMLQALFLVLLSCFMFNIRPIGDMVPFILATTAYVACSVLFGIMLGAVTKSQTIAVQSTSTGGFFPSLLLSGFVYPLTNIPMAIQLASYLVPARYYIHLLRDTFNQGANLESGLKTTAILLVFIAVFLVLSKRGFEGPAKTGGDPT